METETVKEQNPETPTVKTAGPETKVETLAENALLNGGADTVSTNEPNVLETNIPMSSTPIVDERTALPPTQNPNDVKFKVKYDSSFKGAKTLPEGSIQVVSKESAEHFTKLGIGKVVK